MEDSFLKVSTLYFSESMEQVPCTMKVPSSITAATSVSAVHIVRVGGAENGRVSPSSLSLSQALCVVLESKVFTSLESKRGDPNGKMPLINSKNQVASQVECLHVVRHQCQE